MNIDVIKIYLYIIYFFYNSIIIENILNILENRDFLYVLKNVNFFFFF